MATEPFKAILTYKEDGELKWAFDDYKNWEEVREDAGMLLKEASDVPGDARVSAVSNHGHSLEVSKEESVNDM